MPVLAAAQAPDKSLRPVLRPLAISETHAETLAPLRSPRPKLRPDGRSAASAAVQKVVVEQTITEDIVLRQSTSALIKLPRARLRPSDLVVFAKPVALGIGTARDRLAAPATPTSAVAPETVSLSPFAVSRSLKPRGRPKGLRTAFVDTRRNDAGPAVRYSRKGSVCGVRGIRGRTVPPVRGKGGCGIKSAVRVTEVDGVKLTREALVGCDVAKALHGWVRKQAKPTIGRKGGGLAKIQMIAGYSCRTRNSRKGAKLSEHAKGKAVDIAGFVLKNGTTMSVLRDYRSGPHARTMQRLHKTACGPFGTVLGPFANRYHQDHFHFDVARYRGGAYCK